MGSHYVDVHNFSNPVSNQESRSWNPGHILVTVSLSHAGSKGLFSCNSCLFLRVPYDCYGSTNNSALINNCGSINRAIQWEQDTKPHGAKIPDLSSPTINEYKMAGTCNDMSFPNSSFLSWVIQGKRLRSQRLLVQTIHRGTCRMNG